MNNDLIKMPLTVGEFTREIVRPAILRALERGQLDDVIRDMLADYQSGEIKFDDEIVRAMVARAYIVCTLPGPWEGDVKCGAQLRIKLPRVSA